MTMNVTIIGAGLIGSSLSRALLAAQDRYPCCITLYDKNPDVRAQADKLNIAHVIAPTLEDGVRDADIIVIATPVGAVKAVAQAMRSDLKSGVLVTDTGSSKQSIIRDLSEALPQGTQIVPAHPIAGTEESGPAAGFAELFEGRYCILTPPETAELSSLDKISALWQATGARVEIMTAARHDQVLAMTSHLPHLIAYGIISSAARLEEDTRSGVMTYSAGGFRGFTRIAASDPVMWRDVFLHNKDDVLAAISRFQDDIDALKEAIEHEDSAMLEGWFTRVRKIRRAFDRSELDKHGG